MDERQRRQYLQAMGIQSWAGRQAGGGDGMETVSPDPVPERRSATGGTSAPRPMEGPAASPVPEWMQEIPPLLDEHPGEMDEGFPPYGDISLESPGLNGVDRLDWEGLQRRVVECQRCELHKTRTQTVFGTGNRDADLMVIGEAPGAEEDRKGEPFVGRAGQLLNAMLAAIGFQREQVYIANILKCRPPDNRDPREEEARCCEPFLQRQVALVRPRVILAAGRVAAQNLLKSSDAVGKLRGRKFDYQGIPLVVTYHPAYLLRSPEQKARAWQDLQRVMGRLRAN